MGSRASENVKWLDELAPAADKLIPLYEVMGTDRTMQPARSTLTLILKVATMKQLDVFGDDDISN
jgi:hypothetical protein